VHKPLESTSTLNRLPHLADKLLHFNLSDELRQLRKRTHGLVEARLGLSVGPLRESLLEI